MAQLGPTSVDGALTLSLAAAAADQAMRKGETDAALATKAPTGHTHATSEVTGLDAALAGKAASGHTHVIANVTGLQTALDAKAAATHTHAIADITALQAALDAKAALSHTHATSEVTGLDAALAGKAAASHTHAIGDTTGLQAALDGKSGLGHLHPISEIVSLPSTLALKADSTHTHIIADVTALQTALDAKAALTHTHTTLDNGLVITNPSADAALKIKTSSAGYVGNVFELRDSTDEITAYITASGVISANGSFLVNLAADELTTGTVANERLTENLAAIGGLTSAADRFPYFTGIGGASALATLTALGRTLLAGADAAAMRGSLDVGRTGHIIWVDDTYGVDASAAEYRSDRPCKTLATARTLAAAGDTIVVLPGAYTCLISLLKNSVDWHFMTGTAVTFASNTLTAGIFDDGGSAVICKITGNGSFTRSTTDNDLVFHAVRSSHSGSRISIEADLINSIGGIDNGCSSVNGAAGVLDVKAREITNSGSNGYGIWWTNGTLRVDANRVTSSNLAVSGAVSATPTGDFELHVKEILGGVLMGGTEATAAAWIRAETIRGNGISFAVAGIVSGSSNRLYIEAQKIFGEVLCGGGLLYVRTDKIAAWQNGVSGSASLIQVTGGMARITVGHLDPLPFTGETVQVTGGELRLKGFDMLNAGGSSSSKGFEITGGTARLTQFLIDSSANAATNPITKSGGTLILQGGTLVAEATRDSIFSAAAQNVALYGATVANRAKNANITLTVGGAGVFIVDAAVI